MVVLVVIAVVILHFFSCVCVLKVLFGTLYCLLLLMVVVLVRFSLFIYLCIISRLLIWFPMASLIYLFDADSVHVFLVFNQLLWENLCFVFNCFPSVVLFVILRVSFLCVLIIWVVFSGEFIVFWFVVLLGFFF